MPQTAGPLPPSVTSLSADDSATFFTETLAAISAQFSDLPEQVLPCLDI